MPASPRWLVAKYDDPTVLRKLNAVATVFWVVMIPISYAMHWLESVVYVSALSLWALVSGHLSAWQAARVEERQEADANVQDVIDKLEEAAAEAEDAAEQVEEAADDAAEVAHTTGGIHPIVIAPHVQMDGSGVRLEWPQESPAVSVAMSREEAVRFAQLIEAAIGARHED